MFGEVIWETERSWNCFRKIGKVELLLEGLMMLLKF